MLRLSHLPDLWLGRVANAATRLGGRQVSR